jgi:hypothetical protein
MKSPLSSGARVAVLIVAGAIVVGAVAAGPLRGTRSDIAHQKHDVHLQLAVTKGQLASVQAQKRTLDAQFSVTQRQLDIVTRQLQIAEQQKGLTQELVAMQRQLLETLDLQRRLLAIAQETLDQVKQINEKIPSTKR